MTTSFVVLLAIGTIVATGSRLSAQALRNTDLKRESSVCVRLMENMVRETASDAIEVNADGDVLTLDPGSADSCAFYADGGDLLQVKGDTSTVLVNGKVTALSFAFVDDAAYDDPLLRINLQLANSEMAASTTTLVKLRN